MLYGIAKVDGKRTIHRKVYKFYKDLMPYRNIQWKANATLQKSMEC